MVIYLQCSLTLDRDYFAYRAIVTHPGPTTDGGARGGGGGCVIVTHPGAANWDGSAGVARLFFCCWHNKRCHPGVLIYLCVLRLLVKQVNLIRHYYYPEYFG